MKIKNIIFMLNKVISDITSPRERYPLTEDLHSQNLGYYYFVFDEKRVAAGKDQKLIKKFDENGIPINRTYIDVTDKQYVYFPISIGQMGLSVFHTYLQTKKDVDFLRFMKFVDWFYNHVEIDDTLGARWLTDVSLPQYKNPGPWQSAFSQARGISILLRGYQQTGLKKYLDLAELALQPFTLPVSKGGVTSFTEFGPFYEEYTAEVPTLVLNGMIFSLCGIYDFVRVFPEHELASELYHNGIKTLTKTIKEYDIGYWSRYNLCKADWYPEIDLATITYQHLHILQLELLYRLTENDVFKTYAARFKKQVKVINMIKMYITKYHGLKKLKRL